MYKYTIAAFTEQGALQLKLESDEKLTHDEIKMETQKELIKQNRYVEIDSMIYSEHSDKIMPRVYRQEDGEITEITSKREIFNMARKLRKVGGKKNGDH